MAVPPSAESWSIRRPAIMLVNRAPRGLHAAHAAELADVILARDQGHDYGQESGSAERLSRDVLHCPSLSLRRAQAASGLFEHARSGSAPPPGSPRAESPDRPRTEV